LGRSLGVGIALVGIVFVAVAVARQWDELRVLLSSAHLGVLLAALAAATAGMLTIALSWLIALRIFGAEMSALAALRAYFRGEAGKYIPGTVWAVVGRAELAVRAGAARSSAYCSVAVGLVALYSGAAVVSMLTFAYHWSAGAWVPFAATGAVLIIGGLLMTGTVWSAVSDWLRRSSKGAVWLPARSQFLGLVALSVPTWLLIGTTTWFLTWSLWPTAPFKSVLFATAFSWLGGFLAVPVPGGLGVREALFVASLASAPPGVAPAAAVLARLTFMLVDGAAAVLASVSGSRNWVPKS